MDSERRGYVEAMIEVAKDFPDGAFWGFMEEKGISVEEVVEATSEPSGAEEKP